MCTTCFENEIEQFDSANDFQLFEIKLEQKLKQKDGLFFFRQGAETELISYTIYACKSCNSKWYLHLPNSLSLGFLLYEVNAKLLLNKIKASDTKRRTITMIISFIIMLICLFVLADMV
jgi:hypothetical protein